MHTERQSWQVKDVALLSELITLLDVTREERAALAALAPHARAVAPDLSAAFYQRLLQHEPTAEYFGGRDADVADRHGTLRDWFVDLFSGTYDADYAAKRLAIGRRHVEVGIPVRYPLAMIDLVLDVGTQVTTHSDQPAVAKTALEKLLALDIAIFTQAYEDTQLKHLSELVGGERLARRLLMGNA